MSTYESTAVSNSNYRDLRRYNANTTKISIEPLSFRIQIVAVRVLEYLRVCYAYKRIFSNGDYLISKTDLISPQLGFYRSINAVILNLYRLELIVRH